MHYEGLLDRSAHDIALQKARFWFSLCHILNTTLIGLPASFLPSDQTTGDHDTLVSDLRVLADEGARVSPPIRFAYEALSWSTHINRWEDSWELVQAVDRPNLGLCIDTFNILAQTYADPAADNGLAADAHATTSASAARLMDVLQHHADRVFMLQVVDGERCAQPIRGDHPWSQPGMEPRMAWSRNARCFPGETARGAYLPVLQLLEGVARTSKKSDSGTTAAAPAGAWTRDSGVDLGCDATLNPSNADTHPPYAGPISLELFSRTTQEKGARVPATHAARAMRSWFWMRRQLSWDAVASAEHELEHESEIEGDEPAAVKARTKRIVAAMEARLRLDARSRDEAEGVLGYMSDDQ